MWADFKGGGSLTMKIYPNVPVVFPGRMIGMYGHVNSVQGWGYFSKEYLHANAGKLLTLDIDIGENCSLNCPHCFRRDGVVNWSGKPILSYKETLEIVSQAKPLGLEEIKILGAGEPFENPIFLKFLAEMKDFGIKVAVFTKGHVLGDDKLVERYFWQDGIRFAEQLVEKIANELTNVSILLGFNSFDPEIQDQMVGVTGYTLKRNMALELLAQADMNAGQPTRLCLVVAPLTKDNIGEMVEINCWARNRNLYPIITPSMCAGRATDEWRDINPTAEELIEVYAKVNIDNVRSWTLSIGELLENGVSAYAGAAPCNQIACGMYVTSRGIVLRCPGDDTTVFSADIRKEPLADIWYRSENYARRGTYNCHCPPKDGRTIPLNLYDEVLRRVVKHFA